MKQLITKKMNANNFCFRAWHVKAKEMLENNHQGFEGDVFNWLREGQDIKIMQGILRLDINGKRIFAGDIVKWGHVEGYSESIPRIAVVVCCPDVEFHTINLGDNNHIFRIGSFAYRDSISRCMEVIGNIYENPELIK